MTNNRPLSYESLKTVLEHMDAIKRCHLASCCPSIRKTEKAVPLKLETLKLDGLSVRINDTVYKPGTYRQYPSGSEVPKLHQAQNDEGGTIADLDRFGLSEKENKAVVKPGDVFIKLVDDREEMQFEDVDDDTIIASLQSTIKEIEDGRLREFDLDELNDCRAVLQPYLNKRDNLLPEYKIMTHITMTSPNSTEFVRFEKKSQLHEVMKAFLWNLFAGRRHSVAVKKLTIRDNVQALHFPNDLKLKVRELNVHPMSLSALDPIFDVESGPLELLKTFKPNISSENFRHPREMSAKKILVDVEFDNHTLARVPLDFPSQEIHFRNNISSSGQRALLCRNVLKNWTTNGRKIGDRLSFSVPWWGKERKMMKQLVRVCKLFNGIKTGERSIKVPIDSTSEISVVYNGAKHIVSFTVVPTSF